MATQMAVTIFLGVWGGMKLDQYFETKIPVYTLILSLVSVVLAVYMVIRDFLRK
jgi:F0F1-type ATP synthase assembly protein I